MGGYIPEIAEMAGSNGQTVILMMDQSKISDGFECLMVSLRVGERAIPVAWKVIKTKGAIGFDVQKALLDNVIKMIPEDARILLAGDRFGACPVAGRGHFITCQLVSKARLAVSNQA